jgi:hypothetical protein
MNRQRCKGLTIWPATAILFAIAACPIAQSKERNDANLSTATVGGLLAGRYDNSAQVIRGKAENPAPQHVIISVEPTQRADWQIWRVHMDVDPEVAQTAGSDTSLDAVWAMNISRKAADQSLELIPYSLTPSVDIASVKASAFDEGQWIPLEACMLRGDFGASRIGVQVPPDEMCVAVTMGLGGKRAFLPNSIEREGDWLHIQLMYFGKPWRVNAQRVPAGTSGT